MKEVQITQVDIDKETLEQKRRPPSMSFGSAGPRWQQAHCTRLLTDYDEG